MRFEVDLRQNQLFDSFRPVLSDMAYRYLKRTWFAVFRAVILELMPVDELGRHFDPAIGRPTKELYSMAGLIFIMEFRDWTVSEAVHGYVFDNAMHYALNLEPAKQSLSTATVERYQRLFRENDVARKIFDDVVVALVDALDLDVTRQRLDSTHVTSNMATFGRTRLLTVTIKRFLTQLKRHDGKAFEDLPEAFRGRYGPTEKKLFSGSNSDGRKRVRQECAEDLLFLIERFADNEKHNHRQTYRMMLRVFDDQCEVEQEAVIVKKKTGGDVVQNPSDPDATYDGHKGPGYQAQLAESCSEENEQQLVLSAQVETAVKSDQNAVEPILDDLKAKGMLPKTLTADSHYGSDENCAKANERSVDLQSPVSANHSTNEDDPHRLNIDDFVIEPELETVTRCPVGHEPLSSSYDEKKGITITIMPKEACAGCRFGAECPIKRSRGEFQLRHSPKDRRLAERRREQATVAFKEHYAVRAQIEGTISGIKRKTGAGKLRVRGLKAVAHSILLKLAGWNILRAVVCTKMRKKIQQLFELRAAPDSLIALLSSPVALFSLSFSPATRAIFRHYFRRSTSRFKTRSRLHAHQPINLSAFVRIAA